MQNKNSNLLLPSIFFVALILRLVGIGHSFPFIFHIDEPAVTRAALEIRFFPNPGHFDWPHLFIYLNFILYMVFGKLRMLIEFLNIRATFGDYIGILWNDSVIYYLLSRIFAATLGALTVVPLYLAAKETFSKRAGVFAALALAVTPFHVWHSHYALLDVPMMFFASWSLYFALKILTRGETSDYAGAGFYSGLAASVKYNGALMTLAIPFAHLLRSFKRKEKKLSAAGIKNILLAALLSILAFMIGTPYALLDFDTFKRTDGPKGALWQFKNVGSVNWDERIPKFFSEMSTKVSDDLGYTILIGFFMLAGILILRAIQSTKNQMREDVHQLWFLFVSGLLLMFYVTGFDKSRSHYFFIAYPFVLVSFAYVVEFIFQKASRIKPVLGLVVFLAFFGPPAYFSVQNAFTFVKNDTRVHLYNWLTQHVTSTDVLYHNTDEVRQVVDKMNNTRVRGAPKYPTSASGYYIVSYGDALVTENDPALRLKLVAQINNKFRLGPVIQVYSLNK